jgi:hypothetical protein
MQSHSNILPCLDSADVVDNERAVDNFYCGQPTSCTVTNFAPQVPSTVAADS